MELCLNDNAGGVYPKFDMTFRHTNAAAAGAVPPPTFQVFNVNAAATNANPVKLTCLCSKCRPV